MKQLLFSADMLLSIASVARAQSPTVKPAPLEAFRAVFKPGMSQ